MTKSMMIKELSIFTNPWLYRIPWCTKKQCPSDSGSSVASNGDVKAIRLKGKRYVKDDKKGCAFSRPRSDFIVESTGCSGTRKAMCEASKRQHLAKQIDSSPFRPNSDMASSKHHIAGKDAVAVLYFFIWVPGYPFFTNRFRCDFSRVATELRLDYAMIWRSWALSFQRWFSQWHQVSHFRTFFRQQKWYSQYLCMLSCYVCRKTEEV